MKASSVSCLVKIKRLSGSRANTPEPEIRSMASFALALPLAKCAPKAMAAPVSGV